MYRTHCKYRFKRNTPVGFGLRTSGGSGGGHAAPTACPWDADLAGKCKGTDQAICFNQYTLMSTCISAVVAQAQVLAEKAEEQLAIPLNAGLEEEEGLQDEDEMYKNLLAAAPVQALAQRDKQHVPRQLPPAWL